MTSQHKSGSQYIISNKTTSVRSENHIAKHTAYFSNAGHQPPSPKQKYPRANVRSKAAPVVVRQKVFNEFPYSVAKTGAKRPIYVCNPTSKQLTKPEQKKSVEGSELCRGQT